MLVAIGLISAYFVALTLMLRIQSRTVSGPWLFLMRGFLPNWRFFHAVDLRPRLHVRGRIGAEWSPWIVIHPRARRRLSHLIFNPTGNLLLLEQTLVEHLAADVAECDDGAKVGDLVPYQMVARLARQKLLLATPLADAFQFRLCAEDPTCQDPASADALLLSPELATS
jgi:hypothetical protein